jgi:hypothetical protein
MTVAPAAMGQDVEMKPADPVPLSTLSREHHRRRFLENTLDGVVCVS